MADKKADLAGPGIGTYEEVERALPSDYESLLDVKDTQKAIFAVIADITVVAEVAAEVVDVAAAISAAAATPEVFIIVAATDAMTATVNALPGAVPAKVFSTITTTCSLSIFLPRDRRVRTLSSDSSSMSATCFTDFSWR